MATAKEDLEDLITCEICLNRFTDPRSLPCVHVFCLKCIQGIHRTASNNPNNKLKDNEFRCPKCQAVSVLPGNSTDNLPKFFHAGNLSDIVESLTKKHNVCGICNVGHQKVSRYCFTCAKVLCKSCHTLKRYNSHVCVDVTAGNFQTVVCGKHDKLIEAYCTDCCVAVCAQCMLVTHEDHDIHEFIIRKEPFDDPTPELSANKASNKQQIRKIENMQKDFNSHIDDLHGKITSHTDKLIAQITDQDKALHAKLDRHRQVTNRELEKMRRNLADSDGMIALAKAQTTQFIRPIPELSPLGLQNVNKLLASIKHNIPQIKDELPDYTYYQFIPQASSVDIGKLIEACSVLDNTQAQKSSVFAARTSGGRHDTVPEVSLPAATARLSPGPQLVSQIDPPGPVWDMAWTPDGELLVVVGLSLRLYNTRGDMKPLPPALSGIQGTVRSVAVHTRTQSVAVIAVTGSGFHLYVTTLGSGRGETRQHKLPDAWYCKVRFTDGGDLLVVVDHETLIKYNIKDLSQQWQRDTNHYAEYIAVSQDKIIVCGDNQLSVLSEDGQWLSSFPASSDTHRLAAPRWVCTDSSGNVYVVDEEKQAVIMFGPDGSYVREVMKIKEDFCIIALCETKYMAVASATSQLTRSSDQPNILLYQL